MKNFRTDKSASSSDDWFGYAVTFIALHFFAVFGLGILSPNEAMWLLIAKATAIAGIVTGMQWLLNRSERS